MKDVLIKEYNNLIQLNVPYKQDDNNSFNFNFLRGSFLEILGSKKNDYTVKFIDKKQNKIVYESIIQNNMWAKPNIEYFVDWRIEVYNTANKLLFEHDYDASNKRVYIHIDSSAIGDTLAWFPYVIDFKNKHKCDLICSTFHNDWFEKEYPEIEFISPGTEVKDLYAMYVIGWFYDENKNINYSRTPINFRQYPLGETSSSILGLEYIEKKPKITIPDETRQIKEKYVVIAPHASAHAKYWNHPGGWQKIIDYLNEKEYKVLMITQESASDGWHNSKLGKPLYNIIDKTGNHPITDRMIDIKHADLFIGVGSGLSWLSWVIGTPTILISGFSLPYSEFTCERIFNYDDKICTGCFNKYWLDPGDWEWCPEHKNTKRQFECTKTIDFSQVIMSLNKILNIY